MSTVRLEDRIQAIRWKLGIPGNAEPEAELRRHWAAMQQAPGELDAAVQLAANKLGLLFATVLKSKMTGQPNANVAWAEGLADAFTKWAIDNQGAVLPKLSGVLRTALDAPRPPAPPKGTGLHPLARQPPRNALTPNPAGPPPKAREYAAAPPPLPPSEPPPMPTWRFLTPPAGPDAHAESDARDSSSPGHGLKLFGARVRGKKHKHDGTHCDDWFHFAVAGPWTLIAVADGAGSKKLSRVGAKAACETAALELIADLSNHRLDARASVGEWQAALPMTEFGPAFPPDLDKVQAALHRAMTRAYDEVVAAAEDRAVRPESTAALGRPVEVGDLSCTLLVAAHCVVACGDTSFDLVMACQVGDGMVGVVGHDGSARPLGIADGGGYSGETEFLTSAGKLDAAALRRKTAVFLGRMQALTVMTDGVADDYFPAESELGRLWADLLLNGIPDATASDAGGFAGTVLPGPDEYAAEFELIDASEPRRKVRLRSAAAFAERLGRSVTELLRAPALLTAAAVPPLAGDTASERLRLWLDVYQVRGSFDDRTLVVLHRETLP